METKSLSLIIPSYKQEKTIVSDIRFLQKELLKLPYKSEIIVVLDGELDDSLSKLQKAKKKAISQIIENLQNENPVTVTYKTLLASAENHPVVHKIEEQIAENEVLIEYLSKIESNFRSMSYDIKNLIEIIRLETT